MPLTLFDRSLDSLNSTDTSSDRDNQFGHPSAARVDPKPLTPRPRGNWGKRMIGFVVLVGVSSWLAANRPWQAWTHQSVAAESSHHTSPLKVVNVEHPTQAQSAQVELPATIQSWQMTSLHARVSGYLKVWHKELGSSVKSGELLAEIETPELDQELAVAKGQALEASTATDQAKAELVEAQSDLKVAEAQLKRVKAEAELATTQLARRAKLLKSKIIPEEEYDTFEKDLEAKTAIVAAAQSDLERRRANLKTRATIIATRQATEKSRQSNVDRLNELQGFKRIVAPFNGVITRRNAEVGMLITAGKEPLFQMEDLSRVRIQVSVPQTYAQQTRPGSEAKIGLPESAAQKVAAHITRTSESVDPVNRTMLAEIELENATHRFQPGSYAKVTLTAVQHQQTWTIPSNTVAMRVEGPQVATVNSDNRIELKKVRLGRDLGNRVVVLEGIQGQERLVVNPGDDLLNGLRIQIAPKTDATPKVASR